MVTEQRIKTKLPFKYEPVPSVFVIGSKTLTVAEPAYYTICGSTTEEYAHYYLFIPKIEDTIEIWGSGYRDLYPKERDFPYRELVRVQEPTYTTVENEFYNLAEQWKQECPRGADVQEMAMHPSYQRIIGMGPNVVPLLLKELECEPEHLFWALHSITGVNPVPPEGEGKLKEMAEAWIDWGKKQGYRW